MDPMPQQTIAKQILFTVDVEDWFQVENLKGVIPSSSWSTCEVRVERNLHRLLDLLDSVPAADYRRSCSIGDKRPTSSKTPGVIKATFFVLGWIAERFPQLVRAIHSRGHEVASHGYSHILCSSSTLEEFKRDVDYSKKILEEITGQEIYGYRAPSFSIHDDALSILQEVGYLYDSSLNTFALNSRYGKLDIGSNPTIGIARKISHRFYEFPISQFKLGKYSFPFGGGGYFRFLPISLFVAGVSAILKEQSAYLFYIHPWEIDPDQPRVIGLPPMYRFRHYVNLRTTMSKLSVFLNRMNSRQFVTCRQYLVDKSALDS